MADCMTTKVLDATTISAGMSDIKVVDLIERCASKYSLTTTREVRREIEHGFSPDEVERTFSFIHVSSVRSPESDTLLAYLQSRYPFLHSGELSSFLLALFNYELEGEPYFYVTDDAAMRKSIPKILKSDRLIKTLGMTVTNFRSTGTIGLIVRLYQRGCLTKKELVEITDELERSTFRVSASILKELRRAIDEA